MSDVPIRRTPMLSGDLQAGDELSERYRIIRQIGSGGMGAVYEAEQIKLHKRVALKFIHPDRAERDKSIKRFLREARAVSAIKHRNVVDILDFGELDDGTTYLVMELLQGTDLSALLKREGPLSWPRARGILLQVLRGLRAAHSLKIIHRDIKPANIFLLDPDDEYAQEDDRIKVLDFGIARFEQGDDETHELTDTSEMLGTVTYMAPELARKGQQATVQSDLYAVGIMAYKMLTGMTPFGGGTGLQVLYAQIHDEPPSPRSLEPSIPEAVEAIILRTLAKNPDHRFQGTDELGQALAGIDEDGKVTLSEMSDALRRSAFFNTSSTTMPRSPTMTDGAVARSVVRKWWTIGVLVALGITLIGALWMMSSSEPSGRFSERDEMAAAVFRDWDAMDVEAKEKYESGDFSGAADVWTRLLDQAPEIQAIQGARSRVLRSMLEARVDAYADVRLGDGSKALEQLHKGARALDAYLSKLRAAYGDSSELSAEVREEVDAFQRVLQEAELEVAEAAQAEAVEMPIEDSGATGGSEGADAEQHSSSGELEGTSSGGEEPALARPKRRTRSRRRAMPALDASPEISRPEPPVPVKPRETLSSSTMASMKAKAVKASRWCGKRYGTLESRVTVKFTVKPDGVVAKAVALSPMSEKPEGNCAAGEVEKLVFPESLRGVASETWTLPL